MAPNISKLLLFVVFYVFIVSGKRKCSEFGPVAQAHLGQCQSDCVANAAALVAECAQYARYGANSRVTFGSPATCVLRACTKTAMNHDHDKHGIGRSACNTVMGVTSLCQGDPHLDTGCRYGACSEGVVGLCHNGPAPLKHLTIANDAGPGAAGDVCTRANRPTRVYTWERWDICGSAGDPNLFPLEWTGICRGVARAVDSNYGEDYHQLRIIAGDNDVDVYEEENDISFNEYKTFANMLRLEREQSYWRGYENGILAQAQRMHKRF